jgi:hypothetical protein
MDDFKTLIKLKMKNQLVIYTCLFLIISFLNPLHLAQAEQQDDDHEYRVRNMLTLDGFSYREKGGVDVYDLFPNYKQEKDTKPFKLWDFKLDLKTPTCQEPGFFFDFQGYVASFAEMQEYIDEHAQSVAMGIALIYLESTFPEYATVKKWIEQMSMLKKEIENFNCQGVMDGLREHKVFDSISKYADCVEREQRKGHNRDDAEVFCSDTLGKVENFLRPGGESVESWDIIDEIIKWAKEKSVSGDLVVIGSKKDLEDLKKIMGSYVISADMAQMEKVTTLRQYILSLKKKMKADIFKLIRTCDGNFDKESQTCIVSPQTGDYAGMESLKSADILGYETLELNSGYAVSPIIIMYLTIIPEGDQRNRAVEEIAWQLSFDKGSFLFNNCTEIVKHVGSLDGAVNYKTVLDGLCDRLEVDLANIKAIRDKEIAVKKAEQLLINEALKHKQIYLRDLKQNVK